MNKINTATGAGGGQQRPAKAPAKATPPAKKK